MEVVGGYLITIDQSYTFINLYQVPVPQPRSQESWEWAIIELNNKLKEHNETFRFIRVGWPRTLHPHMMQMGPPHVLIATQRMEDDRMDPRVFNEFKEGPDDIHIKRWIMTKLRMGAQDWKYYPFTTIPDPNYRINEFGTVD